MRVVDASATVDVLVRRVPPTSMGHEDLAAPHLIDIEVAHTLRRLERAKVITPVEAARALERFGRLYLSRYPATWLLPRIWELRHNLTGYDATYVALAEALEATSLLTADERLTRATGVRCAIELI